MVCDTQRSITRQWIWANTLRTAVLLGHSANNNILRCRNCNLKFILISFNMADDLANNWGTNLCLPDKYRRSLRSLPLPKVFGSGDRRTSSNVTLSTLVAAETSQQFTFERVAICGSQANHWAIDDATNLNSSTCLFGAGSYVAGDGSALQSFSTSQFTLGAELALITPPQDVRNPAARTNTIPLPYHIPGVMKTKALMAYEDECLQAVHIRLCWAKMRRKPYKAILLELMLAGNGAILSNRALVSIGKLAIHHQLCVIVDEIMTGGRTGAMFFLLSKPPSFQAVVTHITFGKWSQMGMVFLSKTWAEKRQSMYEVTKRGASTFLCEEEAVTHWQCVLQSLNEIPAKRAKCLNKLKLKVEHVWGQGLIIFGPSKRETMQGLKCRYLPLIHANTPLDSVRSTLLMPHHPQHYKRHVNKLITDATKEWVLDTPQPQPIENLIPAEQKMDVESLSDFAFIAKLIKESNELEEKSSEGWKTDYMAEGTNRSQGESALARLKDAGYIVATQKGKKRTRNWKLTDGFIAPWKSIDFDQIVIDVVAEVIE